MNNCASEYISHVSCCEKYSHSLILSTVHHEPCEICVEELSGSNNKLEIKNSLIFCQSLGTLKSF